MKHEECTWNNTNAARRKLFAQVNRTIENIPPTKAALCQHILRSMIQASKWYTCLETHRNTTRTRVNGAGS